MNIHLRADRTNSVHTKFTVFIDGRNTGSLTMGVDEACSFHQIVAHGKGKGIDTFISTGCWDLQLSDGEQPGEAG